MTHKLKRLIFIGISFLLVAMLGIQTQGNSVQALSGNEFKAGRIMDDSLFFYGNSLKHTDVQAFLNSKVPVCDTNGTKPYQSTGLTRAQWAAANGRPTPPYTCLKDFSMNIPGKAPDAFCGGGIGSGTKTAAMIIVEVANACNINAKVLLVLLQKEQSFITDDWPWPVQYEKATGFSCPDTAPCDPEFAGFFNQVYYAARQFQRYAKNATSYNYRAGRNNFIQYHPNSTCGGTSIFLTGQATAGLYNYTPYQPNAAALNNLYGTGDGCSAYGNRNFWRMYNDWFGGTITDFKWWTTGYKILDKTESFYVDPGKLQPGEIYLAKLHAYNTGSSTWRRDGPTPMVLGSVGQNSIFCIQSWIACNRPARMVENTVAPGQLGHFMFHFRAPFAPGEYREDFKPLAEMLSWTNNANGQTFGIKVVNPGSFKWSSTGYKILTPDESKYVDPGKLKPNTLYLAKLHAYNTGTATWHKKGPTPVMLATSLPTGRNSAVCDNTTWIACSRPATLVEDKVSPGQLGHFMFLFRTPNTPGEHREQFKPVAEMLSWFNDTPEASFGIWVK